jgi:type II secretory pathway component PulF
MLRNVIDTVAVVVLGGFVGYIVMVVYLPVFRLGQII